MKKIHFKAVLFTLLMLTVLYGCSGKKNAESASPSPSASSSASATVAQLADQEVDEASAQWFATLFPDKTGSTWHYSTPGGTDDWLVLANVEREQDGRLARFIFEGESASEGEAGHPAHAHAVYEADPTGVYLVLAGERLPLLHARLVEGAGWVGRWHDVAVGFYEARFSLKNVAADAVTVVIQPADVHTGDSTSGISTEISLKTGSGIIREARPGANGSTSEVRTLSKISSVSPPAYSSRYVTPTRIVAKMATDANFEEKLLQEVRVWLAAHASAAASECVDELDSIFGMYAGDSAAQTADLAVHSARAATLLMIGSRSGADADPLILWFDGFHARYVQAKASLAEDIDTGDSRLIEAIFRSNPSTWRYEPIPPGEIDDPEARTVAMLLEENGFQITWSEGWPYFIQRPDYVLDAFSAKASPVVRRWLELENWNLSHHPLADDGGLIVDMNELIDHIADLDDMAAKWPDTEQAESARSEAHNLLEWILVPTDWFMNTPVYTDGRIVESVLEAYSTAAKKHPDSPSVAIVAHVRDLLSESGGLYSPAIHAYLKEQGFTSFSEQTMQEMERYQSRLTDLASLSKAEAAPLTEQQSQAIPLTVGSAEELLRAIGSNRYIQLKPGDYTLPDVWSGEHVRIEAGECFITGVDNLMLVGQGDLPPVIRANSYGYALHFESGSNLRIENVSIGHISTYCRGGVVGLKDMQSVVFDRCIFYGCGYWGIDAVNSKDLKLYRSVVSDCDTTALELYNAEYVDISSCIFSRNGRMVASFDGSSHVRLNQLQVRDNTGESGEAALFLLNECTDVVSTGLSASGNANAAVQKATGESMTLK